MRLENQGEGEVLYNHPSLGIAKLALKSSLTNSTLSLIQPSPRLRRTKRGERKDGVK
jgi:hypothetical protein